MQKLAHICGEVVMVFSLVDGGADACVRCSTLAVTALTAQAAGGDLAVFLVLLAFTDSAILTLVHLFTFASSLVGRPQSILFVEKL